MNDSLVKWLSDCHVLIINLKKSMENRSPVPSCVASLDVVYLWKNFRWFSFSPMTCLMWESRQGDTENENNQSYRTPRPKWMTEARAKEVNAQPTPCLQDCALKSRRQWFIQIINSWLKIQHSRSWIVTRASVLWECTLLIGTVTAALTELRFDTCAILVWPNYQNKINITLALLYLSYFHVHSSM